MREGDKGRKDSLRRQKPLAAQARRTATEPGELNSLVIGVGPGLCSVDIEGDIRHVRCEIPVVPGDKVCVLNDSASGIAPRPTVLIVACLRRITNWAEFGGFKVLIRLPGCATSSSYSFI
jgi:hypothetical protein